MRFRSLLAGLLFVVSAAFAPALYAAEAPRYAEGEAIVVMRDGAALSSKSMARGATAAPTGSVIQRFRPVKLKGSAQSRGAAAGALSTDGAQLAVMHLRAPEGMGTEEFIEELRKDPNVVSATPNYIMRLSSVSQPDSADASSSGDSTLTPNVSRWSEQWGPNAIKAPELWAAAGAGNGSVVVAVIDTGVMYDHPALAPNMYTFDEATAKAITQANPDMLTGEVPLAGSHGAWFHTLVGDTEATGIIGIPIGPEPMYLEDSEEEETLIINKGTPAEMSRIGDINGHGTHVAGTIGAYVNPQTREGAGEVAGVNWNVKIMPVNIFSYTIHGGSALLSDQIRGIDFLLAAKEAGVNIRAANLSLGGWQSPDDESLSAESLKIEEMSDAGIIVCIAAGNEGQDIDDPKGDYAGKKVYPACERFENTISVGALMKKADGTILPDTPDNNDDSYSNYSSSGEWVDVFAPGTAILSTCRTHPLDEDEPDKTLYNASGYVLSDGTSMAAPHVTGAAALLASIFPEKSASEIKALILEGADGSVAKEGYSAYGMLDVYNAWLLGCSDDSNTGGNGGGGCSAGFGALALLAAAALPVMRMRKR